MGNTSRILLDLTTSYRWRGREAVGISRTERAIALQLLSDPTLEVTPFRFYNGELLPLCENEALDLARGLARGLAPPPAAGTQRLRPCRLLLRLLPRSMRPAMSLALTRLRAAMCRLAARGPKGMGLQVSGNDVLFSCGAGWEYMDWHAISSLRARTGMRLVAFCYDTIPLCFPQWDPGPRGCFQRYFRGMVEQADALVCISHTTERDILAFARQNGCTPPPTKVVHLGSDLPVAKSRINVLPSHLSGRRFALVVGTFEIRKNHALLLDVWDRLTREPCFDLDLVIVGARGWLADAVMQRLEQSPLLGTRIFWLTDASDATLSQLYEACHMVLVPSLYEGWGLPVVEALRHRRPVIASNRGAIAEAGFGVAVHLDPEDRWAWCAAISGMAMAPRAYSPPVALPSWSEAGRAVSAVLGEVAIQSVRNSGAQDRYGFRLAMWTRKWSATAAKMVRRWSGRIKPWPA